MSINKTKVMLFLIAILMLTVCTPAFAEPADVQEISVANRPVKGQIELEKQGPMMKGFYKHADTFGNTVNTPLYATDWLEGAVFEVRAVEDVIGRDGTLWYRADELVDTMITTAEKAVRSRLLPLGHYSITEISAPEGYAFEKTRYDVLLEANDHETPVVSIGIIAVNDFMNTRIMLTKEKEILNTETGPDGMIHTQLVNVPGEGFVFGLYNQQPIQYKGGTLEADSLIATAVTDKNGTLTLKGRFPIGEYYIKELSGPDGWHLNSERHAVRIMGDASDGQEMVIRLDEPVHNELIHADVRISKTDLTGSNYLPHTLIEVKNAEGEVVLKDYTGEDGYLPAFQAVPGKYTYREVLAPEGYELCVTELAFEVNAEGRIEGKTAVADDYTRFSLLKVDEFHKPLAGVEFGLFREDGTQQASAVSDSNGLVTFEKIPYGTYTIRETKALTGYLKAHTDVPIVIDGTFVNPREPIAVIENCESEILIKKIDQDGQPIQGAEFGLYSGDGKLIMTTVSDAEGLARFVGMAYGKYTVRELTAPDGYLPSHQAVSITIDDSYANSGLPAAAFVNQRKKIMCIKTDPSGKPLPGVEFVLLNAQTMEVAETAISDKDGAFSFYGFDYGDWIIREMAAPEGYSAMEDIRFHVGDDWTQPKPILCVNIPNHYEFVKTDSEGKPLEGVKFRLEDEKGTELGVYESDKNGIVSMIGLKPGTYVIREIETLEGFTLSGDVIKVKLDEYYVVPEKMKQWINYTTIQTGVHLAVTGVMWVGLASMLVSGTVFFVKRRKQH